MDEKRYYFANGTEQRGPYSLQEFLSLGLRADTLVWHDGMSDWQRLDSFPELNIPAAQAAPQAPALAPLVHSQPIGYRSAYSSPPSSGFAVASLVLGIIADVSLCAGHFSVIALPCSILAVVFGSIAR